MVSSLFHSGTHRTLHLWAEQRMCAMSPEGVAGIMEGFAGYDLSEAFRNAGVPIRAINGDLWPTDVERNRRVTARLRRGSHDRRRSLPDA
jgi:hypothetical protein